MKQNLRIKFFLLLALAMVGSSNVWGISQTSLTANAVGGGTVAVTTSSSAPSSYGSSDSKSQYHGGVTIKAEDTYYVWVKPNSGFSCSVSEGTLQSNGSYKISFKGSTTGVNKTITATFTATFYGKAVSYANPSAGGGTWISLNGNWPTSDANYIAEDSSTKNASGTSAPSFSAQYDAKAKDGYEFVGWYTGTNGSGTKTSGDKRYTEAFTATSVSSSSPTTITRYAYFRALQYYYFKIQANKVGTGAVYASFTNSSFSQTSDTKSERAETLAQTQSKGNYTAYFKAQETSSDYHFAGWYTDAACTEANRVSTNLTYSTTISGSTGTSEATAKTTTLYAKFVQELTPEVTANYVGEPKALFVDDIITNAYSFLNTSAIGSGLSVTSSNSNVIVYDAATNKVTAKNEGTATLTVTQTKTGIIKAGEFTFTFNVSKITNTLTADATHSMKVDEQWNGVVSTNSDATITTSSNNETVAYYDIVNNRILAPNSNNQSFVSKEVTITISQAATYKYTAASKTITVTVNKHENTIYTNSSTSFAPSIYMDAQQAIALTATNTDYANCPITASQTVGSDIAVLNGAQTQVTSNHNLGVATWSLSQPENYKYKAGSGLFTVNVVKQSEATDCYVKTDLNSDHEFSDSWEMTWNDENAAKQLTFDAKCQAAWTYGLYVCQYINGSWSSAEEGAANTTYISYGELSTGYQTFHVNLNAQAKGVKFVKRGTLKRYVKNIYVSRNTFLTTADVTVNKTSANNPIYPTETGVGSITINHSLANGGDLKVTWDNAKFTIDGKTSAQGINLGDKGCSTGNTTLPITYTSQVAGEDVAHLVIYNNVYRATATITGVTVKRNQTLTWKENIDILSEGTIVENAATVTLNNVTYSSDHPEIVAIEDGKLHAVAAGEATITAHADGDTEYNEISDTKKITVTEDKVQYIVWDQSLTNLKLGDPNKTLNASAQSDVPGCSTGGARPITYTSSNESIVKIVNSNQLQVVGVGTAIVTATQAGGKDADGHIYAPASMQKKAVVRDPSAACVNYIYEQTSEVKMDCGWNAASHQTKTSEINFNGQEPGSCNFDFKGEPINVLIDYYAGTMSVEQYVNGSWQEVKSLGKPSTSGWVNTGDITLNRAATKMRVKVSDAMGYHYFKDCQVTLARYIEAANTLNKFIAKVGESQQQTLSIKYSNIEGALTFSLLSSGSSFSLSTTSKEGECGDKGTQDIVITYNPQAEEDANIVLRISDGKTNLDITLQGEATKTNRHIVWEQTPAPVYTIQTVTLTAEARTDLDAKAGEVYYYMNNLSSTTGTIFSNTLSFTQDGTAEVVAQTVADAKYSDAAAVSKTWTVSKTPTTISTMPTAFGDIVSGTDIASLTLTGWEVTNTVNSEVVEGTLAITAGDLVNVGDKNLTLTFTPTNTNMFASCTANMPVHVIQRAATDAEIGTIAASDITYGAAVKNSTLSNTGINGTWSWTDAKKDDVLDAGTYDNLQVHFVPQDANIAEKDAIVSLTVNKAQPTITWNGESTYAWGKIDNLFSADNGAAVTMTSLDETIAKIEDNQIVPVKASTVVIRGAIDETANYLAASLDQSITFNAPAENIFTNAAGDNDWNNKANWTSGVAPATTEDVNVIINGEMVIDETIIVNSMTIESGASVKVIVNGDLSIHDASLSRDNYGDLFIKNGGAVELSSTSSKKMMVHNFVIESSIGTDGTSTSGQISNADALAFDEGGDAYIDINLDPLGIADDSKWYGFTVPFEVEIATGIARKENDGSFKVLADKTNFDIMKYNPAKRLNTGKGWEYYHGTLQPGEFYLLAIDGTNNVYSFRKKAGAALVSDGTMALKTNGTGTNANWNAVGNPTMQQVKAEFSNKIVQVYLNGLNQYKAVSTEDANFVVGCPFFIQASTNENLTLTADNSHSAFYTPRREANVSDMFRVRFGQDAEHYSDQIFVSASEDALNQYEIGHDVAKVGVGTISAQLWVNAYSQKLCAHEAVLTNNNADFALTLYAPKAGEYTVSINREKMPNDAALYLTENGNIIWNLSTSDYTVELNKGNNTNYGLRLVQERRITTDTENVETKAQTNKMIINSNMYIFREGKIYDATGKLVK